MWQLDRSFCMCPVFHYQLSFHQCSIFILIHLPSTRDTECAAKQLTHNTAGPAISVSHRYSNMQPQLIYSLLLPNQQFLRVLCVSHGNALKHGIRHHEMCYTLVKTADKTVNRHVYFHNTLMIIICF